MDGSDLELKGLSLVDEDDCLIDSSHQFDSHLSGNQMSPASFKGKGAEVDGIEDGSGNINQTPEQLRSCERGSGTDGKYNLRQSLAWDSAFFTNAGVLDSEELTSILEDAEMKKKQTLPRIEEETQRSTDSISTLESDSFSTASLESGLFEDIRASIQKSSGASNVKNASRKTGVVVPRMPDVNTSKMVGVTSIGKLNSRPSSEKPSFGTVSTGKTTKHVISRPQVPQPQGKAMAKGGASVQLLSRQPKLARTSLASTSTKRDSTGGSRIKAEKDNAGSAINRRASVSKVQNVMGSSCSNLPKPKQSSRSSPSSVASKEPTTSCSLLDSSGCALSDNIEKSTLKTKGKCVNTKTRNPVVGPTLQTPSKSSQPSVSSLSAYLRSAAKQSSNISPASSISEWSAESCSSSSTVNQRSSSSQASFDTSSSSNVVYANGDLSQDWELQVNSHEKHLVGVEGEEMAAPLAHARSSSAAGGVLLPNSMKPTGLRMPSPKIGFFDGVKSRCSPNSSRRSNPITFSGSSKVEAGGVNPLGGLTKGKTGRLPSARMIGATVVAGPDSKLMASAMMPKSREPSNATVKVSTALRNVKRSPSISATFQNGMHHKCQDKSQLNVHRVDAKRCDGTANNLAAGSAEKCSTRDEEKSEIKFINLAETVKVTSTGHGSDVTSIEVTIKTMDVASADNEIGLCRNFDHSLNTEKPISDDSSILCHGVRKHPSPRDQSVFSQKESLNSSSKIPPSCLPTKPIVVSSRLPFTVKDSITNVDNSSDFSRFTTSRVEKSLELPSSDRVKENC